MGDADQSVQTSGYEISMFWSCNIHMATVVNNVVYLQDAKRGDLSSSHQRQKIEVLWDDGCVS